MLQHYIGHHLSQSGYYANFSFVVIATTGSVSASIKDIAVTGIPKDYSEVVMVSADNDKSSNDAVVTFGIEINPLDDPEKDIVVSTSVLPLRVIYDEVSL